MTSAESFLNEVSRSLAVLRESRRRYSARLAPDFNVLEYDPMDELRLSKLLADLLNPKGRHGQDGRFLESFLRDVCGYDQYELRASQARVHTEVSTAHLDNDMRRLDILIEFDGLALGIENKPWAADQELQLTDYAVELGRRSDGWHILYLTPDGMQPSEESVSPDEWKKWLRDEGRAKEISYAQISDWIKDCIAQCESERVRCFLSDFREYLRKTFEGVSDMAESNEIKNLALANAETLSTALTISANISEIKKDLIVRLDMELSQIFDEKGWKRAYGNKNKLTDIKRFSGLTVKTTNGYRISWEFQQGNWNLSAYGLDRDNPNIDRQDQLVEKLNHEIAKGLTNNDWLWFHYIQGSDYANWSNSDKPWVGILKEEKNGHSKTANFIVEKLLGLDNLVKGFLGI